MPWARASAAARLQYRPLGTVCLVKVSTTSWTTPWETTTAAGSDVMGISSHRGVSLVQLVVIPQLPFKVGPGNPGARIIIYTFGGECKSRDLGHMLRNDAGGSLA